MVMAVWKRPPPKPTKKNKFWVIIRRVWFGSPGSGSDPVWFDVTVAGLQWGWDRHGQSQGEEIDDDVLSQLQASQKPRYLTGISASCLTIFYILKPFTSTLNWSGIIWKVLWFFALCPDGGITLKGAHNPPPPFFQPLNSVLVVIWKFLQWWMLCGCELQKMLGMYWLRYIEIGNW